jgi:hypothetical protein
MQGGVCVCMCVCVSSEFKLLGLHSRISASVTQIKSSDKERDLCELGSEGLRAGDRQSSRVGCSVLEF